MKRSYPTFLALGFLTITACGSGNSAPNKAQQQTPQVTIPADALVADYSCNEVAEFRESNGILQTETKETRGVSYDWTTNGEANSYTMTDDGGDHSLLRGRSETLTFNTFRITGEVQTWTRQGNGLVFRRQALERIWEKNGNLQRALSNKLDGLDAPYYWDIETVRIDLKNQRIVQRHTYPQARNSTVRAYEKIENTCFYRDREITK